MIYTRFCRSCKKQVDIEMSLEQLKELTHGVKNIQEIFPTHTPEQREILISGICGDCFDQLFPVEEEELEDIEIDWNFEDEED